MFGQVRQDQPAFAAGCQMRRQTAEKSAQHAAVGVVDRIFDRRAGSRRQPRRIADHQRGPSRREQVSL